MASKSDTRAAVATSAETGVAAPDVEAIDKVELPESLLEELQDKKAAASAGTVAAPEGSAIKPLVTVYEVAAGKSLTSLSGTKKAGAEVTARDFSGGEATLAHWVKSGFVTKSERELADEPA
jgi:hypothetical protein